MHEVLVIISRVLAIIAIINTIYCICVRIINIISKKKILIFSNFVFIPLFIASIICNVLVIICDFVKDSVMPSDMTHIVLYFVMCGMVNFIITTVLFMISVYKVTFQKDCIVISRALRAKETVNILDIDQKKSEYILVNRKSVFKNSVLLNYDEYVVLFDKNGKKTKIGLNTFIYLGKNIEPLIYIASDLKLARREIKWF